MEYSQQLISRKTLLWLMRSAALAWALSALMVAQTRASDTARILSLENAWNGAEVNHDVHSLELLIADTFVYTDEDGVFMNRREWLNSIRDHVGEYELLATRESR